MSIKIMSTADQSVMEMLLRNYNNDLIQQGKSEEEIIKAMFTREKELRLKFER